MYLTSFIHRDALFSITERWLCGRLEAGDGKRITEILICDGFVVGVTLRLLTQSLLEMIYVKPFEVSPIRLKGELRDLLCRNPLEKTPRVEEMICHYRANPDFYYREAPISGNTYLDAQGHLIGISRTKRPRRIAEKANRYIANWIFRLVRARAQNMAEERALSLGVPLERLVTPREQMAREFTEAEESIAQKFREETVKLERSALAIHDVAGIKVIAQDEKLSELKERLSDHPSVKVIDQEECQGHYQAKNLIIEVSWNRDDICRQFRDGHAWKRYLNRGLPEEVLRRGIEDLIEESLPTLNIELILTTFPNLVESEFGRSIHEERIVAQRDHKIYKGYLPLNVEFLIEYLFAVGLSPQANIDTLPIKLWGRYLPDTISSHIRQLYRMPELSSF